VKDAGLDRDRAIFLANVARRAGSPSPASIDAERSLESRFGCSRRLAIYGSLAPGESNHHHIADLRGTWEDASVRGRKIDRGWGAKTGYPGLELSSGGDEVPVMLFLSDDLPAAWARLDAFEGRDYCRVGGEDGRRGERLRAAARMRRRRE
jgi:gamma-glutamylcyclotransferase (GGCT)/AIG2-like uncharacterized protein YtfP